MSTQLEMMRSFKGLEGMLVKMTKSSDPMILVGTCYGRYPSLVLSRIRPAVGQSFVYVHSTQHFAEIDGVKYETYDAYGRGAKEVKVTTPKFFFVDGAWVTSEQFFS